MNVKIIGKGTCVLQVAQSYVTNARNMQAYNRIHFVELITPLEHDADMNHDSKKSIRHMHVEMQYSSLNLQRCLKHLF